MLDYVSPPLWVTVCDTVTLLEDTGNSHHNLSIPQFNFSRSANIFRSLPLLSEENQILKVEVVEWSHPGKFGFVNIHSVGSQSSDIISSSSSSDPKCDSFGDMYAWNIADWTVDNSVERVVHDQLLLLGNRFYFSCILLCNRIHPSN